MIGLAVIFWTLWQSYNIFTAKVSAPLVFKGQPQQKSSPVRSLETSQQIQEQLEEAIQKQINEILPLDALNKILNLLSWSILAGILIFGSGQISHLGIKMIRGK